MKELILDGSSLSGMEELHRRFAETFSFPDYYGANLDALFDCLTDLREEATVVLVNRGELLEKIGSRAYGGLCRVLVNAGEENPRLKTELR